MDVDPTTVDDLVLAVGSDEMSKWNYYEPLGWVGGAAVECACVLAASPAIRPTEECSK